MLSQSRDVLGDDRPHEFKIEAEIFMDHDVAKRGDLRPRDLRVGFAKRGRQPSAGLTQQRQAVQYRALNQNVAQERFPTPLGKPGNQFDLLDGIEQTEAVCPHS